MIIELTFPVLVAVALGGMLGAAARLVLDMYVRGGVLLANTAGSLVLGIMLGVSAAGSGEWAPLALGFLAAGFAGALSTFSTVSLRAAQLWIADSRGKAAGLWLVHTACGLTAAAGGAWLGWALAG